MMMERNGNSPAVESRENELGPVVFFGGHACDVHALRILDMLYLSYYSDPYYRRNRHNLTFVGYGCMPDDKCFCHSLGTSNVDDGFDLFLNPLDGRFLVTVASARGDDIVQANTWVVSTNYFRVLGVPLLLGGGFTGEVGESQKEHPEVVLSHGFWLRRFGGDPRSTREPLYVNGVPFRM